MDCRQHTLDQEYAMGDNLNLYGILVGVTGTNRFGDFDPKEMCDALLKSKVFVKDADIGSLDTVRWSMQMMEFLPIGFPEGYLVTLSRATSSTIANISRIELRRGGSRWHILIILPLVNAEG